MLECQPVNDTAREETWSAKLQKQCKKRCFLEIWNACVQRLKYYRRKIISLETKFMQTLSLDAVFSRNEYQERTPIPVRGTSSTMLSSNVYQLTREINVCTQVWIKFTFFYVEAQGARLVYNTNMTECCERCISGRSWRTTDCNLEELERWSWDTAAVGPRATTRRGTLTAWEQDVASSSSQYVLVATCRAYICILRTEHCSLGLRPWTWYTGSPPTAQNFLWGFVVIPLITE